MKVCVSKEKALSFLSDKEIAGMGLTTFFPIFAGIFA
jgi:hypothetical protein